MNRPCFSGVACAVLVASFAAQSARAEVADGNASGGLSVTERPKRAGWQERLTLGPGDLLNIALYDVEDTERRDVPVGPDGRITFLQARDIQAAGLTIDELRDKLDQALSQYYQNPHATISPSAVRSKKYIVLGAVANKGVYNFDRPLTVIEACARAGGLQTGVYERNTVELADLGRSFLVRNGKRVPVNFEKLFMRGDLSQNVALEPDDYLYFALANSNEIYVLGEVGAPGIAAFLPRSSVISAVTARGGFTARAYKSRVLVVRGSLDQPQTFVVNTSDILAGKAPDFQLQPKDIVYVSLSPWVKAQEIFDTAAYAFIQSFVVTTTTRKIEPLTTSPWIK
jgi:protein involved in polysaccharide export with SLBB domain